MSTTTTDQTLSLPAVFSRALSSASDVYHLSSIEDETQTLIASAIADLQDVSKRISSLSLFSNNETLEDVATKDLVYMFVPYVAGEVLGRSRTVGVEERMSSLQQSKNRFQAFIRLLEDYDIVQEDEKRLYSQRGGSGGGGVSLNDAAKRREAKINQYKKEKELRARVLALRARRGHAEVESPNDFDLIVSLLPNTSSSSSSRPTTGDRTTPRTVDDEDNNDDEDDDVARETTLVLLRLMWTQALSQLDSMKQELDLLRSAPVPDPTATSSAANRESNVVDQTWRLDQIPASGGPDGRGPLLDGQGRPLRPFTILPSGAAAERARLQSEVFRPDHRLPTMTMDEYLEEERRRGKFISGGGHASQEAPTSSEQLTMDSEQDGTRFGEEKEEEKRKKDEEWAQFTDANPKGWGNTMNRG